MSKLFLNLFRKIEKIIFKKSYISTFTLRLSEILLKFLFYPLVIKPKQTHHTTPHYIKILKVSLNSK